MKIASVAHVKARLSSYLKASATAPVVVTRNGKAVAVLLGVEDDEHLERLLLANSRKLRALLDAATGGRGGRTIELGGERRALLRGGRVQIVHSA